jgi:hypothetical protein
MLPFTWECSEMPKIKHCSFKPVVVDWDGLKQMGWPFCRTETVERNGGRYPQSFTLGNHFNARRLWRVAEVLAYFEKHGLRVTEDWYAPEKGQTPPEKEDNGPAEK